MIIAALLNVVFMVSYALEDVNMKILLSAVFAACFALSSSIFADDIRPIELSAEQMDSVTASGLGLPNGREVFANFDNPAPFDLHPTFDNDTGGGARSTTAANYNGGAGDPTSATGDPDRGGHGPPNGIFGNEGAWSAHVMSPVIICIGC